MFGVAVVETTNNLTAGTAAGGVNTEATGSNYASIVLGGQAFGVPHMTAVAATGSPYAPKVTILDAPDKSDIYGQRTIASFKTFYTAKQLNPAFYRVVWSKSNFA